MDSGGFCDDMFYNNEDDEPVLQRMFYLEQHLNGKITSAWEKRAHPTEAIKCIINEFKDNPVTFKKGDWFMTGSVIQPMKINKGDKIKVKILEINTEKERVSLSVKHLIEDPVQDYISKNPVKSIVSGKIISVDEKGIAVNLAENINGFIKKSNLSKNKAEQKIDRFAKEEVLDSMIVSYDNKLRKINLSIKDKEIEEEKKTLLEYGSSDSGASLGDILSDALIKEKEKQPDK